MRSGKINPTPTPLRARIAYNHSRRATNGVAKMEKPTSRKAAETRSRSLIQRVSVPDNNVVKVVAERKQRRRMPRSALEAPSC
jgi:hypothetical protein